MTNTLALYGPGYLPVCRNVPDISRESKSSDAYLMTVTEQHPDLLDWLFANQHVGLTLWGCRTGSTSSSIETSPLSTGLATSSSPGRPAAP